MRRLAATIFATGVAWVLALGCDAAPAEPAKAVEAKTTAAAPAAAKAPPVAPPKPDQPGGEFCATIIPCFQKLEFSGSFSADVTVDVEPDGRVSSVSFTGQAPQPVQTCITDTIKAITLAEHEGEPGRVRCTQSGQLTGGAQMVMSDRSYETRAPGGTAAPADGKADSPP